MTRRPLRTIVAPGPEVWWGWREAFGLVIAAHAVLIVAGSIIVGSQPTKGAVIPIPRQFVATLPFWVVAVIGSLWLARRGGEDPRRALGLALRPLDIPLGVVIGVVLQLGVIPLLYRLSGVDLDELERPARQLAGAARGGVATVLFVLMTCLFAPIAEELMYRAVLQRGGGRSSALAGLVVAALVFGLAHFQPLQFPGLALFGATSGLVVWWTGRTGPGIVAHMAFNATTVVALLADRPR